MVRSQANLFHDALNFENMGFFLPKKVVFFDLLKDVSADLKEIAALFGEFARDFRDIEKYAHKAKEIERKADLKTHEVINRLNKTFITPFDREDIYLLAHELDDIIDLIENVMHNIKLYQITRKIAAIDEFAPLIFEAADYLQKLLECLQKQKYTQEFLNIKIKIHELEDKGDETFRKGIGSLFQEEKDPIFILKLKDILESLEDVMDKYQHVSDIIEGIIVKSS